MKIFYLISALLIPGPLMAADSFLERRCYTGCTFYGVDKGEKACKAVADGINSISNAKVQLVASCRLDRNSDFCRQGEFCSFPNIVLETQFFVH